jgi:putative hydrolases of HD superfamily
VLDKNFVLRIFEGFSIERWNDLIRPFDLVEMDNAAEKMIAAYLIGKFEENKGNTIDWVWMIYASLFDLLRKIALCDIKSPVQRMIRQEYPQEYARLNEWVVEQYCQIIHDPDLFAQFTTYIGQMTGSIPLDPGRKHTFRVLQAAHKFSSYRELEMISRINEPERIQKIRKEMNGDLEQYLDLRGMQLLLTNQRPYDFIVMIEQLRFQTRWNQTPRVPRTSVLGHCFFVAIMTLLLGRDSSVQYCPARIYNNFFSALFHDLPEAVTRDIISPVKQATDELPSVVKHIEDEIVKKELVPLMEPFFADELLYFTNSEFSNRVKKTPDSSGDIELVTWDELNEKYNSAGYAPVDGRLVRLSDHLAAFIEADSSIMHGITSEHLRSGRENLLKMYSEQHCINGIDAVNLFRTISS